MKRKKFFQLALFFGIILVNPITIKSQNHTRARDLGIPFEGNPGKHNSITDIPGVEVGYKTLISGEGKLEVGKGPVRTGVTVVLPKGKTQKNYPMGYFIFNGDGEVTGLPLIHDYGVGQGPIGITNTYSVGIVRDAIGEWCYNNFQPAGRHNFSFGLPVTGETYDGGLNDINGFHIKKEHVFEALDKAKSGSLKEGNVGGGTGMVCYWFKGGTGTASRKILIGEKHYTVGVMVQTNFGFRNDLMVKGVPVGNELSDTLMPDVKQDGSIIVIVGTDAPLTASQLNLVAKRVTLGIGRTGSCGSSGSGDIFLAFSTQEIQQNHETKIHNLQKVDKRWLNRVYRGTVECTEEAIINALVAAEDMKGVNGNTFYALPHNELKQIMKKYNRLQE